MISTRIRFLLASLLLAQSAANNFEVSFAAALQNPSAATEAEREAIKKATEAAIDKGLATPGSWTDSRRNLRNLVTCTATAHCANYYECNTSDPRVQNCIHVCRCDFYTNRKLSVPSGTSGRGEGQNIILRTLISLQQQCDSAIKRFGSDCIVGFHDTTGTGVDYYKMPNNGPIIRTAGGEGINVNELLGFVPTDSVQRINLTKQGL